MLQPCCDNFTASLQCQSVQDHETVSTKFGEYYEAITQTDELVLTHLGTHPNRSYYRG